MHRVYNRLHDLNVTLRGVVESKKLWPNMENCLNRQTATRAAAAWQRKLLGVVHCACEKLWKYVGKHLDLAKQACVLGPTIMAPLRSEIDQFPLIFAHNVPLCIMVSRNCIEIMCSLQPPNLISYSGGKP